MARIHLIIGPVGSGKSTFAIQLARERGAVRLTLDDWMAVLFGNDERPAHGRLSWYRERVARCLEQIWSVTCDVLEVDRDVVLEVGLVRREQREAFYGRIDAAAFDHTVYVVDADREVRRERVRRRNEERGDTWAMDVPPEIFELASNMWEPPDELERRDRDIQYV